MVTAFEGRTFEMTASISSRGLNAASNVTANVTLPASFTILQASLAGGAAVGTCQTTTTTVTCTIPSLPRGTGTTITIQASPAQPGDFPGNVISVSTPNDSVPTNDTQQVRIIVGEDVDVSVTGPTTLVGGIVDQPVDIPVTVRTGLRVIGDVTFTLVAGTAMEFVSVSPQLPCTMVGTTLTCPMGNLAAQSTLPMTVRVRFTSPTNIDAFARVNGTNDTLPNNDSAVFRVDVDQPADLALLAPRPSISAVAGQEFLAEVQLSAPGPFAGRNVTVQATLSSGVTLRSVTQSCSSFQNQVVTCPIGTFAQGTSRLLGFNLVAAAAGTHTIDFRVVATNDSNGQNDSSQVTVVASAAPPPPPPPPAAAPSGGGGGGALGGAWLLLLAGAHALRARQTQSLRNCVKPK
jgi:hypothetical protein